jgi:pilus assembly protein CpaE
VTTFAPGTERDTVRVIATGDFEGKDDLRGILESSESGIDVVVWTSEVRDAIPYLALDDIGAILIGAGRDGSTVAALADDVAAVRRHTRAAIILLIPDTQTYLVEKALEAGVDDVLVLPQMTETIAFAIRKARYAGGRGVSHPGVPDGPRGRVVTVFSPKGGTGKTVLATNLAALLATRSDRRVLLIDLDLQFGDAAIMLGLDPQRTLYDLVVSPGELDAGKLSAYTTKYKSRLDVLAAPMRPEEAEVVTETKVLQLLDVARSAYDLVVVDTSPFFYGPMLAVLQPTDQLLLLCGLDVPTLKNVKLSLRTLELLGFPAARTDLVLNRVTPKVGLTKHDVEAALALPVRFEVPNDPGVALAVNRGVAAALLEAGSEFTHAVSAIADAMEPVDVAAAGPSTETSKRRWLTARRLLEGRTM